MQALRHGLSQIPDTISNLVGSLPNADSVFPIYRQQQDGPVENQSSSSTVSGDEGHDKAQAIPGSLITEEWQLVLDHEASVADLQGAITRCKQLVVNTDECSSERKWLVRHLVELRFRLNEIQEVIDDPKSGGPTTMVILGHHLVPGTLKSANTVRQYCDNCSGIIWSVVQASYVCIDCNYRVHHKCVHRIGRVCAHVIASETTTPNSEISPEIGLAMQHYKCAECSAPLSFNKTWIESRLCDYSGLYYCTSCHWNDQVTTPARVIHNWDFTPRKVSRGKRLTDYKFYPADDQIMAASLQLLALMHERADIAVVDLNPKLFVYVQNLSLVQKLRENLVHMRRYLDECRFAAADKLVEHHIGTRRYLIQSPRMYSMSDLVAVESGSLVELLNKVVHAFDKHIRRCDICTGKGYLCEICGNNEVMFPYDDGGLQCAECLSMYHRACWVRKNMTCSKCARLTKRKLAQDEIDVNEDGPNGDISGSPENSLEIANRNS